MQIYTFKKPGKAYRVAVAQNVRYHVVHRSSPSGENPSSASPNAYTHHVEVALVGIIETAPRLIR